MNDVAILELLVELLRCSDVVLVAIVELKEQRSVSLSENWNSVGSKCGVFHLQGKRDDAMVDLIVFQWTKCCQSHVASVHEFCPSQEEGLLR